MFRTLGLVATFVVCWSLTSTGQTPSKAAPIAATPPLSLADRLAQNVALVEPLEGKFPDVCRQIAEKFNLTLTLDPALKRLGDQSPLEQKVALPAMRNVRLGTLLRVVIEQADCAYVIHPDRIVITSDIISWYESGNKQSHYERTNGDESTEFLPEPDILRHRPAIRREVISRRYDAKPFAEILADITAQTGANIAMAPELVDVAKQPYTVSFTNAPVDAVVRTLAEMAGVGVTSEANILLVTTKERAAELEAAKKRPRTAVVPPDANQLQQQIQELRRQHEELKKAVGK